jgi:hypothetical protein
MGSSSDFRKFLKDIGLRIFGAIGAVLLIISIAFLGDALDIGFLQSGGGLLISVIVAGEILFLRVLIYAVSRDKL